MHLHGFANMAHVHFKWREVKCYCFWFHYESLFSGRFWLLLLPFLLLLLSRLFARLAYFFSSVVVHRPLYLNKSPYLLLSVFVSQSHSVDLFIWDIFSVRFGTLFFNHHLFVSTTSKTKKIQYLMELRKKIIWKNAHKTYEFFFSAINIIVSTTTKRSFKLSTQFIWNESVNTIY